MIKKKFTVNLSFMLEICSLPIDTIKTMELPPAFSLFVDSMHLSNNGNGENHRIRLLQDFHSAFRVLLHIFIVILPTKV